MLQSFNSLMNWSSRGENGQLRVGVRRLAHQQSSMPSSVISSQSMHLGVLATASHAVSTQTLFVVYYKPRYQMLTFFLKMNYKRRFCLIIPVEYITSLILFAWAKMIRTSQFIISLNKYLEAVNNKVGVGMRFKMNFEGEDSPERK